MEVGLPHTLVGAADARMVVISRGRCVAVQLRDGLAAIHVFNAQLDLALSLADRHTFLRSIRGYIDEGEATPTFAGGDWNFLRPIRSDWTWSAGSAATAPEYRRRLTPCSQISCSARTSSTGSAECSRRSRMRCTAASTVGAPTWAHRR